MGSRGRLFVFLRKQGGISAGKIARGNGAKFLLVRKNVVQQISDLRVDVLLELYVSEVPALKELMQPA